MAVLQGSLAQRRTHIVATVGPASQEPEVLRDLIRAGVDLFRLNLSHGSHAEHQQMFQRIQQASVAVERPVSVLADLCGPRIRVGRFEGGQIELRQGESVQITTRDVLGRPGLIPSLYEGLTRDVRPGDRILLNDGLLELRVESSAQDVQAIVVQGGVLRDRKGMNLPGVAISAPTLTEKDRQDARFAQELGVDFVALSFVRQAQDVIDLRQLLMERAQVQGAEGPKLSVPAIIAKIEKPEALQDIANILAQADGLMVARGDLGVEMPPESVPIIQRDLLRRARLAARPVIVATQMLESMVENPQPTRAEVSDVSSAVFSGTDAVMLSAETAIGAHPIRAVEMMARVARRVEAWQWEQGRFELLQTWRTDFFKDRDASGILQPMPDRQAVANCTAQLSRDLEVQAIVVRSRNGTSARVVSATRPSAPVIAMSTEATVVRRMGLLWGVLPRLISDEEFENPRETARRLAIETGLAQPGQVILLLAGFGKREPSITVITV